MLITDVRAHHIRIPYDAGVASFRHGISATAAVDIVLVEGNEFERLHHAGRIFVDTS